MSLGGFARAARRGFGLAAALLFLNASLSFVSVWPTLAVRPSTHVSIEAAVLVLLLAVAAAYRRRPLGDTSRRAIAATWVVLVVAHYISVSTRSLYGRSVNLYWDLQLLPDVGAMFAYVAHPRVLAAFVAGIVLVPLLIYLPVGWAIGQLARACERRTVRPALMALSVGILAAGAGNAANEDLVPQPRFAPSITAAIAREAVEFAGEASGNHRRIVPDAPDVTNDLAFVRGADVVLLFIESYGVTSWERPEFRQELAPARAALSAAIADSGREVVSAVVESTTFGGESWLAHLSLLSGTEVRDADMNRRVMSSRRDTLVTAFTRGGYHAVAVMPGLHAPWPEGAFYGFDRIYGAPDLDYAGPPFGWWDVTDQFVLARMDDLAIAAQPRPPSFVFLPSISTHAPFTPVPPYQPDWTRLLTAAPYDDDDLVRAYDDAPDWSNLGPGYARALAYVHATLGGYLRHRADRDLVLIVLGDHQPPALVSGEGASWNVPVHVIASRPRVLDRLRARGFRVGLAPEGGALARMDTLMPILLDAFGNTEPSIGSRPPRVTSRGE